MSLVPPAGTAAVRTSGLENEPPLPPMLALHINRQVIHPSRRNLHALVPLDIEDHSPRPEASVSLQNYDVSSSSSSSSTSDDQTKVASANDVHPTFVDAASKRVGVFLDRKFDQLAYRVNKNLPVLPITEPSRPVGHISNSIAEIRAQAARSEHRGYHHVRFPASLLELKEVAPVVHHYFVFIIFWFAFLVVTGLVGLAFTIVSDIMMYTRVHHQPISLWWWFSIGHSDVVLRPFYTVYLIFTGGGSLIWIAVYVWYLRRLRNMNASGNINSSTSTRGRHLGATGNSKRANALDLVRYQNKDHAPARRIDKLRRTMSAPDVTEKTFRRAASRRTLSPPPSVRTLSPPSIRTKMSPKQVRFDDGGRVPDASASTTSSEAETLGHTLAQQRLQFRWKRWRTWGYRLLGTVLFFALLVCQFATNYAIQTLSGRFDSIYIATLLSATLTVFNLIWKPIALRLTRAETHRLMADFNNSIAFKTFAFRLLSTFVLVSLTYDVLRHDGDTVSTSSVACVPDQLSQQYIVSLGTEVVMSFIVGVIVSYVQRRIMWRCCRKSHNGDNFYNPEFSFVQEYDDMIRKLQLVIVALPVAPLMPLGMAVVILCEYYFDQYKLLRICKPVQHMRDKFHHTVGIILLLNTLTAIAVPSGAIFIAREWWQMDGTLC